MALARDLVRLSLMLAMSAVGGGAVNAWRSSPLSLTYETPATRLASASQSEGQSAVTLISLEEMRVLATQAEVLLLDARPDLFFQMGHIPGAANLPKDGFAVAFVKLEPHLRSGAFRQFVIYCSGGDCEDSAFVARELARAGIGPLAIFEGGWEVWEQSEGEP